MLLKEITLNDTVAEGPGIALRRGHFPGSLKEAGSEMQNCLRDKQWSGSTDRFRLTRWEIIKTWWGWNRIKKGAVMAQQ